MPIVVNIVYAVLAFILGSVIGSFLNVVILRTPEKMSIVTEPSHCFSCGHRLAWYDMFPIFSYLLLRGRCRYCGEKFSPRYMIVELMTAVLYCFSYLMFAVFQPADWWKIAFSAVLFPVLIVLSMIDIDRFEIPYWCSGVMAALGIAAIFVFPNDIVWYERLIAMGVILILFAVLVLIGGMGGGDLQLMLGASLLLGYRVFVGLLVGIVCGAVYGSIKKFRDRNAEKELSERIFKLVNKWYEDQLDNGVGFVTDGKSDIIVGSISDGAPDIEWEFLDEKVWQGLPDKSELSRLLREKITDEREGGFKIHISGDRVSKVKYSRRMVFGPFLALGIAVSWFAGSYIVNWYSSLF